MQRAAPQLNLFPDEPTSVVQRPGDLPGLVVRESARARRLSIKVYPRGRVEVVVPRRTRPADVEQFVTENRDWIRRAREEFAGDHGFEEFALPARIELPAVDRLVQVDYRADPSATAVRYRLAGDTLRLSGRTDDEGLCVRALRRWLATVAKAEFAPRLRALSDLTGIPYGRMQVRAQRSCWGSRSSSGTISLNLSLLFLRPELLRYLLVHELCHGRHMNHSRRFWALVEKHQPGSRGLDRELGEAWRDVPVWLGLA